MRKNFINNEEIKRIKNENLKVLRNKKNNLILNVSFSEEGLMFTTNAAGKYLYFNDARLDLNKGFTGDTSKNKSVFVEDYVPQNHKSGFRQKVELFWLRKAQLLISE